MKSSPRNRGAPISNETLGMILFLVCEVMFFAGLVSTYVVLRHGAAEWRPAGMPDPVGPLSVSNTLLLVASGGVMFLATRAVRRDDPVGLRLYLAITMVFGLTFIGVQFFELGRLMAFAPIGTAFGSVFRTLVILHGIHVAGGIVLLGWVLANALRGKYHRYRFTPVAVSSLYWYFVVLVWVFIYYALYVV